MGSLWLYAMSPADRKKFAKANRPEQMTMLMKLVSNGNLDMQQVITILT